MALSLLGYEGATDSVLCGKEDSVFLIISSETSSLRIGLSQGLAEGSYFFSRGGVMWLMPTTSLAKAGSGPPVSQAVHGSGQFC